MRSLKETWRSKAEIKASDVNTHTLSYTLFKTRGTEMKTVGLKLDR